MLPYHHPCRLCSLKFFVKYWPGDSLVPETRTQGYIYALAKDDPQAPGIPKVHDVFYHSYNSYLVMEDDLALSFRAWINQETLSTEERNGRLAIATEKVAAAISWLLTCPTPGDGNWWRPHTAQLFLWGGGCFGILHLALFGNVRQRGRGIYILVSTLTLLRMLFGPRHCAVCLAELCAPSPLQMIVF